MGLAPFVLVLAFVATASVADDKCRSGCNGVTPNKFKFVEGTTYKYNLDSNVEISLSTAEGQQSKTNFKATVLLTQQANCNQVIRLTNVQISGADNKKNTIPDIEKAIRINFHDGHVEDIICAEAGDTQNSLNVKRAVASLFQAATHGNHETDVFGVCPTEISTKKDGNILTIMKSRVLNRCSHRENIRSDFMATAFNLNSEFKSSPILNSDYIQEMKIKDGILEHVQVTENYLFLPFSIGKNGAKAVVTTKLHLAGKSKDAPKNKINDAKSIIFENPHNVISKKSDVTAILNAVKETANSIKTTVGDHTASKFASLLKIVSVSKKDDLLAVYNQIRAGAGFADKTIAKKIFLDAIFRAGTGDSIEVSIELLKNKELSELEQKRVFLGMAFVKHATLPSITTAGALLDQPNLPREAYLAIGTLAARYCKQHECKNVAELNKLEQKLVSKLADGKPKDRNQENIVISVLKAITNVKYLSDAALPKIIAIAQDKKGPSRVRVAALEAYLADACKDKVRDSAISILKDIQQDSEIRIKAYLALASCPNGKVATAIKNVLDNEPSYQVGGYIVSHIRNLRASANPDKELAKRELANVNTMKRFPIDPRKYSYNTEFSYAFDTLGMSSSVENDVIFSQNSFLPRSMGVNLTTEIFGHKINFLEIDTRQENVDKLLEHYLGPLGVLRSKNPEDLLASGKQSMEDILEHLAKRLGKIEREKRDVSKQEIDSIGKQVQIKTSDLNNDLDLDLSLKLFGSELLFLSVNENSETFSPKAIIDRIFNTLEDGIDKVKNFEHVFESNLQFLDTELSYPTSMGFPLRLAVEGTSAVQVKAAGALDIRALFRTKDSLIKLSLIPSANIEIAGRMTLDAIVVESGLKVISSLYSATGGDMKIEVFNDGKGFDMKFALPIQKQELVSANHELVFITRESGLPETKTPMKFIESKDFSICFDHLSPIIGLSACAELNGPNYQLNKGIILPFPLSGNSKLEVSIVKEEEVTYHVRTAVHGRLRPLEEFKPSEKSGCELILETIGPNGAKKVSFAFEAFLNPEMYVKATLDSPIKKATLEGRVVDSKAEKSVFVKFIHDNQEYYGKLGVSVTGSDARATYRPLIEYRTPEDKGVQQSAYTVEGQIIAEKSDGNVKYIFDNVKIIIPNQPTISISGNLGRESTKFFTDLTLANGDLSGTLKGSIHVQDTNTKLHAEMTNNKNPMANFKINYEVTRSAHTVSSNLEFVHGQDLKSKQNTLKLSNSITNKFIDPLNNHYATKNSFSYPVLGVEAKVDFDSKPKHIEYEVKGKYNKIKLGSEMDLKFNEKARGDYDFDFELHGFENKLKAKAKREINGDQSKIDNSLDVNGKKFEVSGTIMHKTKANDVDVGADLTIRVPTHPDALKVDYAYSYIPKDLKTHLKVSTSSSTFIDYDLKASEAAGAKGHLKVAIKDLLMADGDVKADKWVGKAHLVVDFVKIKRKIKQEATFNLAGPTYNVHASMYPNFEKDDTKILVTSNNQIKENSIDSKNVIEAFGKKLEGNFKGHMEGKPLLDGKISGDVEVILPCDMYLAGKITREVHIVDGVGNGNMFVSLEQRKNKNTPGRKGSLKVIAKDVHMEEKTFDITYNLATDDSNGKNLNGDLHLKRTKTGDKRVSEIKGKLSGSVLSEPLELDGSATYEDYAGSYKIVTSCGSKLNMAGKYDAIGNGKPMSGEFSFEAQTTNPKFKVIKMNMGGSLLENADSVDVKGAAGIFIDDDGTQPEATVDISGETELTLAENSGQIKGTLNFQKADPITLALGYGHTEENGISKCQADVSVQYLKNKNFKGDLSLIKPNANEYKLDMKFQTPSIDAKNVRIEVSGKRSDDHKEMLSDVIVTVNGLKYDLNTEIKLSETSPLFSVKLTQPDGKTDVLSYKRDKVGEKHYTSELKAVLNEKDFYLDYSIDANIKNIEDFHVTIKIDSPKLNADKIVLEAKNQHNKSAKVIELSATSAGKNYLKGSTTYKAREEGQKYIVEGSGEFTVKEEKKSGNFKYIRQSLSMEKNGEQGIEISFDASLGNNAVDSELKITNKQFRYLNSYCEEKKQCAHFEIDSKTNKIDVAEYSHELEVNIDLRKLGLSHEFGLKSVTTRKQLVLDHTVDIHFQSQENNKYQYSLYLHPKEAGVSLTTPKRIVSLEGHLDLPKSGKGPIKGEVAFYLNKKAEPKKKTSLSGFFEHSIHDKLAEVKAEAKFTTPGMAKDMIVSYTGKYDTAKHADEFTLLLDVFSKANNKLSVSGKRTIKHENGKWEAELHGYAKSLGLGLELVTDKVFIYDSKKHSVSYNEKHDLTMDGKKYSTKFIYVINPMQLEALVKVLNKDILSVSSRFHVGQTSQEIGTTFHIIGTEPYSSHLQLKNWNTMKFTMNPKSKVEQQLVINSAFIPGQIADFRAELQKKELVHASIKLDETNFLKPDYAMNTELIKNMMTNMRTESAHIVESGKALGNEIMNEANERVKHLGEIAKKNVPNMKPVKEYYAAEFQKLKDEINADKTIQDISEFLKKIFGAAANLISEIIVKINEINEKLMGLIQANIAKITEVFDKDITPKLKEIFNSFAAHFTKVFESISDIFFSLYWQATEFLDKHKDELKELATTISAMSQDLGRFLYMNYERVRELIMTNVQRLYEEIKALPIYEEMKTSYNEFLKNIGGIQEPLINMIKDALNTIKDIVPSKEMKDVIGDFADYVEKKMRQQDVDDIAIIEKIITGFIKATKKILSQFNFKDAKIGEGSNLNIDYLFAMPKLVGAKFSPWNYIMGGDIEIEIEEALYGITFNPKLLIPPFRLYAFIIQGQHIFTFDGKHVTFPGKCNYLLARDAVNGNFTIAGTYTNGLLTALTVADKHDMITIKKGGQVTLNKDATEFPVRRPSIEAFRLYESLHIVSKAGVEVICGPQLVGCLVSVSGFYHGQIRGLLGNGNNEPYDDFTMLNGKIVTSESDFGNSYKLSASCPTIKTVEHSAHHGHRAPSCNELFDGDDSLLELCFPFVNPANFRMACDHGVAAGVKDTESSIAIGYVAACKSRGIPIRVPDEQVKCTNSETPVDVGAQFSVKLPGKAADIVIIVDQIKTNEPVYKEFVTPLVAEVTKELSAKGITDVEFHLITYGGEYQKYPSHVTSAGKLTFKGKPPALKFSEAPKEPSLRTGLDSADRFLNMIRKTQHDLGLALGLDIQAKAYMEAIAYPYRAHATRTILAITGNPCEEGKFLALQKLRSLLFIVKNINLNVVSPFVNFKVKDPKVTKNVIGFNKENVFTFTDAKKKPEGTSELHKDLEYSDYCVDFTIKNNGNVFVSDHFVQAKGAAKKQFVQVAAHNMVDQITGTELGMDCLCSFNGPYTAQNTCKVVHSKEK